MSPSEIQSLTDEKRELESIIKEVGEGVGEGSSGSQIDLNKIKREIAGIQNAIDTRSAPVPKGADKDKLVKEEGELENLIAEGMPTRYEMQFPTKNPGAVRKHMEWCKRNQLRIERYVLIQKMLRPLEPKSIEVLRKDK